MIKSICLVITGCIGSGKSAVATIFADCGARVIDADKISREVVSPGSDALEKIGQTFGDEILETSGEVNRKKLAEIVFSNSQKRELLVKIIQPLIRRRELELLADYQQAGEELIILDIPLYHENTPIDQVDWVIAVSVDEATRYARLAKQGGLKREAIRQRLAAQLSQAEKNSLADYVIDNNGSLENTKEQVMQILNQIKTKH